MNDLHNFQNWLTDLQKFVLLFCAVIHGYDDPGVTNTFLVNTNSLLSLIYNDIQVKENHNISSVFKLFRNPKYNFIRGMNKNEYGYLMTFNNLKFIYLRNYLFSGG